jgi:hypothetical protein
MEQLSDSLCSSSCYKKNFAAWAKPLFQCLDASIDSLSATTSTEHIEGG